ncbi:choice-of-anchor A family protein [Cellulosimicrobium sp. SH8]|uniref:choice-of-anchor A family protein n=1 Tax=Cellulosimicrobium sp. SH8 TaxID=2952936 RepID=UPI0021F2C4CF|nr:choice-of-anchor A family protein [Cellulosimicrobium sp. SH8]
MTHRPPARLVALDRARRATAALVAAALALAGAVALVAGPQARPAAAASGFCPDPDDFPNIGPLPIFTDNNVAVYAGGDYTATGTSAESEGVLVVRGDATFDTPGSFNVGTVGAGSGITPAPGSPMLQVGGVMSIATGTNVIVGANLVGGGAVHVGGDLADAGGLDTNGGAVETNMGADAAIAPWQGFQDAVVDTSAVLGAAPDTGTTARDGGRVTFTSADPGNTTLQAFTVDAAVLDGASEFFFEGIPDGAPIVVNVVGDEPVTVSSAYVDINGERVDDPANIGNAAARTLWNFTGTGDVTVSGAGQWVGSILVPSADQVTLTASTNGRVYAGNDLTTSGSGNEQHNYPWIGPGPFDCIPSASFVVQKTVTGEAAADVPADTTFEVGYTYEEPDGTTGGDTLVVPISGALVSGPTLPVGTVVTITETNLPTVPGVEWGTPVIEVNGEPLGDPAQFTIQENQTVTVTVVNTANGGGVPVVGGFSVAKAVTGDAAGLVPDDTAFLVDWEATLPEGATYDGDLSGTLTVLADGTVVDGPSDLPVGTTVTLTEQTPLPEVDGVEWGEPVLSPASPITIVEGATGVAVTVTNVAGAVVGGFTVQKSLEGDAAGVVPPGTAFLVDWTATVPAGVVYDGDTSGTLTVLADGTVTDGPSDLPVGTTVTLVEQPLPDVDGVVWGLPTLEPASPITIVEGPTSVAVTVTNTANAPEEVGGFAVQKSVTGDASGAVPPGTAFVVAWEAELPPDSGYEGPTSGTVTVLADGTVVDGPQDLPEGTVVTFTEQTMPDVPGVDWGQPTVSPGTVTIGEGDAVAGVVVTNTATAQVGGFSLAKAVEGDLAGSVPPGTTFEAEWSATLPTGFTYDGPLTGTLTVLADGTVVDGPQDLPVGTVVTFTEINLPEVDGVVWGAPTFSPGSVTVGDEENTLVTLTNTTQDVAEVGGFSVAKEVTGDRADLVPAGTEFTVAYSYELDGTLVGGYLQVPADGTVVAGPQNLPVGTVVTFTEADLPEIPGVAWGVPTFSPPTVVVGDGEDTLVTATNTANQAVGGFSVVKRVTGEASDAVPATTEFVVGYAYDGPDGTVTGSLTVRADGVAVDGPQDLPVGTVVRLTETDVPEIGGVDWGTPTFTVDGTAVTEVTVGDGTVVVTLTNTAEDEQLAITGTDAVLVTVLALAFLGAGSALLLFRARRRRPA